MFKKILLCLILSVSIFNVTNLDSAHARGSSNGVLLTKDKTSSTTRVTLKSGEKLSINTFVYSGSIVFTVFKNGKQYQTFAPKKKSFTYKFPNAGPGQYSLRAYCGYPNALKTGCHSIFSITAN